MAVIVVGGGTLEKAGTVCVWSPQCAFLHVYGCTKLHVQISLNAEGQLKDLVMSQVVLRSRKN